MSCGQGTFLVRSKIFPRIGKLVKLVIFHSLTKMEVQMARVSLRFPNVGFESIFILGACNTNVGGGEIE